MPDFGWRATYFPKSTGSLITGDTTDERQRSRITDRVPERFGRLDTVVRAEHTMLRARRDPRRETGGQASNAS